MLRITQQTCCRGQDWAPGPQPPGGCPPSAPGDVTSSSAVSGSQGPAAASGHLASTGLHASGPAFPTSISKPNCTGELSPALLAGTLFPRTSRLCSEGLAGDTWVSSQLIYECHLGKHFCPPAPAASCHPPLPATPSAKDSYEKQLNSNERPRPDPKPTGLQKMPWLLRPRRGGTSALGHPGHAPGQGGCDQSEEIPRNRLAGRPARLGLFLKSSIFHGALGRRPQLTVGVGRSFLIRALGPHPSKGWARSQERGCPQPQSSTAVRERF